MQKLSVTIITCNEERWIRGALESVKWADEIIVLDSGSDDSTLAICREYTPHVFTEAWRGYVEQKNLATEKAAHDWILNIDADERVSRELAEEIQRILREPGARVGYYMPRKTYYLGGWIKYCGWYPDYKLRVFHKRAGKWIGKALHERIEIKGETAYLHHDLIHYTYENMSDHLDKMNGFTSIAASQKTQTVSGAGIFCRTLLTFLKKYLLQQGFRDGTRGLIVSLLSAFTVMVKYAKVWEARYKDTKNTEEKNVRETV